MVLNYGAFMITQILHSNMDKCITRLVDETLLKPDDHDYMNMILEIC